MDAENCTKRCSTCKQRLPFAAFGKDKRRPFGLRDECKKCAAVRAARWREANRERYRQQHQAYAQRRRAKDPAGAIAKDRAYRAQNRTRVQQYGRKSRLRNGYDLTTDQYANMLQAQGGVCAICHEPETITDHRTGATISLAVDHDAATGRVRGLLCARCNVGIGRLRHDPVILQRAIDYLR